MHSLMLFDSTGRKISVDALRRALSSIPQCKQIRESASSGTPLQADYAEGDDFTTIYLISSHEAISIRGTSGAALSAAWAIHAKLGIPLRMVDTDYSFDLLLDQFSTLEQLSAAIDQARAS